MTRPTEGELHAAHRLTIQWPKSRSDAFKIASRMWPRAEPTMIERIVDLWETTSEPKVAPEPAPVVIVSKTA